MLKLLGDVPYQRETSFIIDQNSNAKHLTVGEAYVTEGNWAGFPPHKHDTDNMPKECIACLLYTSDCLTDRTFTTLLKCAAITGKKLKNSASIFPT